MSSMIASLVRGLGEAGVLGRAGPLAVAVMLLTVLAAACTGAHAGPGVAQVSPSASASDSSRTATGPAAFGACMRSHGIANFPDSGQIDLGKLGVDPNLSTFQAAQRACQPLLDTGAGGHRIPAADQARFLAFSACMRSDGVPNFPDPDFSSGATIVMGPGGAIDPSSPQFQAAQKACAHYLPGGGPRTQKVGPGGGAP